VSSPALRHEHQLTSGAVGRLSNLHDSDSLAVRLSLASAPRWETLDRESTGATSRG
jgi:hypothetical protein